MVDVFLGMEMISLQMMTSEGKIIKMRVQRTPFHPPPPVVLKVVSCRGSKTRLLNTPPLNSVAY